MALRSTKDASQRGVAARHDIIVIGASVGGINAVSALVAGLPANLGAAVFVAVHMHAGPSRLPEVLTARGRLKATHALHGETIERNHIYVAPPDNHVLVRQGYMDVQRGARENGHRPSVDVLFRTASNAYGARVIGVVLTGYLDCGTAGLISIKARGGIAVVQDPAEAAAPDMPRSAVEHVGVDHVAKLEDMPDLLVRLVGQAAPPVPEHHSGQIAELEGEELGVPSEVVCPNCQGRLTETEINGFRHFRCHVGHAFSLQGLTVAQADEVERAMWAAARSLDESAALAGRVAARTSGELRARMLEKHNLQVQHAQLVRRLILEGSELTRPDADALSAKPEVARISARRTSNKRG